jgi:DNA repair protein RadC
MSKNKVAECSLVWSNRKRAGQSITSPEDAYRMLRGHWNKDIGVRERFYVACLTRANELIGVSEISSGGVSGCSVDMKLVFGVALKCAASGIIVAHNHPSNSLKPSSNDISLTRKIQAACSLLDITFIDHIIVTSESFNAMRNSHTEIFTDKI